MDNLALAATNDRNVIQELLEANKKLTESNKQLADKIDSITNTVQTIKYCSSSRNNNDIRLPIDPNGYCHTHGWRVNVDIIAAHENGELRVTKKKQHVRTPWVVVTRTSQYDWLGGIVIVTL